MTLTTHATVGTLIGYSVGNPLAGFVLGFISHLILDVIPHGDHQMNLNFRKNKTHIKKVVAYVTMDAIAAIFLVLILVNWKGLGNIEAISWAIAGAILPDLLVGAHDFTKSKYLAWCSRIHFFFHDLIIKKRGDIPLRYSLIVQLLIILLIQSRF